MNGYGYGYGGQKFNAQAYKNKKKSNSAHVPPANMQEKLPLSQQELQQELQNEYRAGLYKDSPHFASNNQIKQEVSDLTEMVRQLMKTHTGNIYLNNEKEQMKDGALSTTDILLIVIIIIIFIAFIFIPFMGGIVANQLRREAIPAKIEINSK